MARGAWVLLALSALVLPAACSVDKGPPYTPITTRGQEPTAKKKETPEELKQRTCRQYVEAKRIALLPRREQKQHVSHVYRNLFSAVQKPYLISAPRVISSEAEAQARTLEEYAAAVFDSAGGARWINAWTRSICIKVLADHKRALAPLVRADFYSGNEEAVRRALWIVYELRMTTFFDSVLAVFRNEGALRTRAAYTLRNLRDPRAIAPMVTQHPDNPTKYFGILRSLQANRQADPVLVKLLRSPKARIRWQAASALAESADGSLIPEVRRLLRDSNPRVRRCAANMGFCMKGRHYEKVRPSLVRLLTDPDAQVRFSAVRSFGYRRDKVCARAVLDFIQGGTLGSHEHHSIVQRMIWITGENFGYHTYIGNDGLWRPTTKNNKAAIARFAAWIEENAPDAPSPKRSE